MSYIVDTIPQSSDMIFDGKLHIIDLIFEYFLGILQ